MEILLLVNVVFGYNIECSNIVFLLLLCCDSDCNVSARYSVSRISCYSGTFFMNFYKF